MCVSRIWRILYKIPGTILSELDEGGPGGFQQSDMLHYGYYSVARPKGAGEEGFIMFQGSEEAFFCVRRIRPVSVPNTLALPFPSLPLCPRTGRISGRADGRASRPA